MPFSAVLLAGGKSSRMGRDKALLPVNGKSLWQHQFDTLRATGAGEILVSGKVDGLYAAACEVVADRWPDAGPLGGVVSALRRCTAPWLLVLAVDMPRMSAEYLRGLVDEAQRTGKAVVPRTAEGHWEPLAAVYPRSAAEIAEELIEAGVLKMERLLDRLSGAAGLCAREVRAEERGLFENWNAPADVVGFAHDA